ncbi:poly-gamma-glutamate synthase PgsB [Bacillus shivajii]|uniref:poly-gamma-glutamate synthase PgsB n=1 Tax=Bacillus shivajii TaxID=1983719 RepID=UPI001CFAD54A|nr:poly-gamma-glutamate synthase PgsB [Bacillus shivajii]UCZ52993.1 poly-gamma-glutamate synthase PgsB [Bacillus shivajii]
MLLIPISLTAVLLLLLGTVERRRHQRNIEKIPVRININGVRGKSTVTRLTTGILKEAGYKTVGKTTGTSARMIYWNSSEEKPIIRDPEGPNIKEQKRVIDEVAETKADALVSECMAVNPDYQVTFQEVLLQANICVIVNVLEDHMDVLGPSLDDVASAFVATIPYNGHLILNDSPYTDMYRSIAEKRNTEVIVADTSQITEDYLRQFPYIIFPENAALALAVSKALNIDEEVARQGMLHSHPDPGALRVMTVENQGHTSPFINAFAANDAHSTLAIWERVQMLGYSGKHPIILMNCREDRVDRTEQFAYDVLPKMEIGTLVLIGSVTSPIVQAHKDGVIDADRVIDLDGKKTNEVFEKILSLVNGDVMFGVGNIHGVAEELMEKIQENEEPHTA